MSFRMRRPGPDLRKDERRDGAIYRSRALLIRLLPVLARVYALHAGPECHPVFGVDWAGAILLMLAWHEQ